MTGFRQDLRYALRGLRQRPGFTLVAVLTLALGIGANTAIFSVVNGVLLRPLPYERPERLAMIWGHRNQEPLAELSVPEYWDLRERTHSFAGVAAFADGNINLTGTGTPERIRAGYFTANTTAVLGVAPAIGRGFTAEEDLPGGPPVVLLGDGLWRRRFGADPEVVGRVLTLDDTPTTVVGVMPPDFQLPTHYAGAPKELWAPMQLDPAINRGVRGWHFLEVIGRLRDGVALDGRERRDVRPSCAACWRRIRWSTRPSSTAGHVREPVGRGRRAARAAGAARRRGAAAPDRLRQRGGPAARAVGGAASGRSRSGPRWGGPLAAGTPTAHREPAARGGRRDCRPAAGRLGRAGAGARGASPRCRGSTRSGSTCACSATRSASRCSPASCSGWRPRCTPCAAICHRRADRRGTRRDNRPGPPAGPAGPRGRAGRRRAGAGDRGGSPGPELPPPPPGRPGIRARAPAHGAGGALAGAI